MYMRHIAELNEDEFREIKKFLQVEIYTRDSSSNKKGWCGFTEEQWDVVKNISCDEITDEIAYGFFDKKDFTNMLFLCNVKKNNEIRKNHESLKNILG